MKSKLIQMAFSLGWQLVTALVFKKMSLRLFRP